MILYVESTGQTLPSFNALYKNGSTVISWNAPTEKLTLLVIQRSIDSSRGFMSIASMPDPNTASNGYVDKSSKSMNYYYRIFYASINGKYFFTDSKKAVIENVIPIVKAAPPKDSVQKVIPLEIKNIDTVNKKNENTAETIETLPKKDLIESILPKIENKATTNFIINLYTEKIGHESNLLANPFLYVSKENNLMLVLPETHKRKFNLQVWKEDGTTIFTMKNIKEAQLLIDRSNFIYSGWFKYEISEGDHLKEKGKFLILPD